MPAIEIENVVQKAFRNFGFLPKCHADIRDDRWLLLYENPYGRAGGSSDRHYVGVFHGSAELYRHPFHTDLAARKFFERRAEEEAE